jgi:hypothetical protein
MTTPVIEAIGALEAEAKSPHSRYLNWITWTFVLVGGYLRFDHTHGTAGRLLVVVSFAIGVVISVQTLRRFILRVTPHLRNADARNRMDAWDRERRTTTWQRTKAAGVVRYLWREGIRWARVLTFWGYSLLILLPGSGTLAVDGAAPLFLRSLVAVAGISLVMALLYSGYRWQRVSTAWSRYEDTYGSGTA